MAISMFDGKRMLIVLESSGIALVRFLAMIDSFVSMIESAE